MTEKAWYTKLSELNRRSGSKEIADWFKESDTRYNVMTFKDIPKQFHGFYISLFEEIEEQTKEELSDKALKLIQKAIILTSKKNPDLSYIECIIIINKLLGSMNPPVKYILRTSFFKKYLPVNFDRLLDTSDSILFNYINICNVFTVLNRKEAAEVASLMIDRLNDDRLKARIPATKDSYIKIYTYYVNLINNIITYNPDRDSILDRLIDDIEKFYPSDILMNIYGFRVKFSSFFDKVKPLILLPQDTNNECKRAMFINLITFILQGFAKQSSDEDRVFHDLYNSLDLSKPIKSEVECSFGKSYNYRHDFSIGSSGFNEKEIDTIFTKFLAAKYGFSTFVRLINEVPVKDRDTIIWTLTYSGSSYALAKILLSDFDNPPAADWYPGKPPPTPVVIPTLPPLPPQASEVPPVPLATQPPEPPQPAKTVVPPPVPKVDGIRQLEPLEKTDGQLRAVTPVKSVASDISVTKPTAAAPTPAPTPPPPTVAPPPATTPPATTPATAATAAAATAASPAPTAVTPPKVTPYSPFNGARHEILYKK